MRSFKYNPLKLDKANIDTLSLGLVGAKSRVLELGCSSGYLGNIMRKDLGCTVIGVEKDAKAARLAKKYLNKVIVGDIENTNIFAQITKNGPYDLVFTSAILEHLVNPQKAVLKLSKLLKKSGSFIITLPNIAHWTARKSILFGSFDYQNSGLFDKTHLHFYTLKSARDFLKKCNLNILKEDYEFFGPKFLSPLFRLFPNLFAYQFVFKAKPT